MDTSPPPESACRNMPIYEFACPNCRVIFSFLAKTTRPDRPPACPKCRGRRMHKQVSRFAAPKGVQEPAGPGPAGGDEPGAGVDEARMMRAMGELERDMDHLDENNPRHMAHMMKKMKDLMPPGSVPKELDIAIKRLEKGEDPESIEADMGDVLGGLLGPEGAEGGSAGGEAAYAKDSGLYDF